MTVVRRLAVNRPEQIELFDDLGRLEIENFSDGALQFFFVHFAGAEGIDTHAHGFGMTDGISELNLASIRQAGCDNILCDPPAHVSCAAIYLRRVFSGERSATVPSHSAIGIANDLTPRYTCITFGTADHEPASGVDQVGR